jgi:hypothetical protein
MLPADQASGEIDIGIEEGATTRRGAAYELGPAPDKRGRCDEARTLLGEIYDWFTEGFDTADLKDAKALLDDLNE